MRPNRDHILALLRNNKLLLEREFPLQRMALFGSVARGESAEDSDIDILVDVDPSIGLRIVTLAERLEELLGHQVDLVSRRAVKPLLWEKIEPELIDV
jgi:predicted nucleotidyltransferase